MEVAMKKGMTLVEMLVALTIMMIVLGAVFSILSIQQTKALNVETTAILQTDAQVALTLLRWDLFMAGYGMTMDDASITSDNSTNEPDKIKLRGVGLGFEADYTDWAPILQGVPGGNEILVYRFNDTMPDFQVGDILIIVDQQKRLLESNCEILGITPITYETAGFTMNGLALTLNKNISVGKGNLVFRPDMNTYTNGIEYTLANKKLMRGDHIFLDNVEDVQFAYGFDLDMNGTIDDAEWFDDLTSVPGYTQHLFYTHKAAIRSTFVMLSERGLRDYTYPADACSLEDHIYTLSSLDKRYKREFVRAISWPRNLQF